MPVRLILTHRCLRCVDTRRVRPLHASSPSSHEARR
jgi:hypothetical protein